ncbi:hypothetical protein GCM10028820_14160 [Tessaracoccus terricola]
MPASDCVAPDPSAPAAYVVSAGDTVATALEEVPPGPVRLRGAMEHVVTAGETIPRGHKLALVPHKSGDPVVKYGITIAEASAQISAGAWVHLHCARSLFDERSASLDPVTGAPQDVNYA